MHALARLIHEVMAAEDVSQPVLARRAGEPKLVSRIQFYADPRRDRIPEVPRPDTIAALARALGRTEREVLIAAGEAAGIDMRDPGSSELSRRLPAVTTALTPEDAHLIAQVVRVIGELRAQDASE